MSPTEITIFTVTSSEAPFVLLSLLLLGSRSPQALLILLYPEYEQCNNSVSTFPNIGLCVYVVYIFVLHMA